MTNRTFFSCLLIFLCSVLSAQVDPGDVTIIRDEYGVPHIFGKTDEAMVYGLAWAHAEDDFNNIQKNLLAAQTNLSAAIGKKGALFDFLVQFAEIDKIVAERYETDLDPKTKAILEAYVAGLNKYAESHPKEVLYKKALPFKPQDVVRGSMVSLTLFSGAAGPARDIFKNKPLAENDEDMPTGSNALAFKKSKTKEGETLLVINPHNSFSGRYSWYECHVHSDEGFDLSGALLPGGVAPFIGYNDDIAWAHTFNYHDLVDVYKLEMHPDKKKLQYKIDDTWKDLEVRKYKVKVKLGFFRLKVGRKTYYSDHGPVLKNKNGYYAIRFNANKDIRPLEQWLEMGRAKNFSDFEEALRMDALPLLNILYADKEDNIYFLSQARFPKRNLGWDYNKVLPGNRSDLIWNEVHDFDERPQLMNPDCGYLFNANNSPLNATSDECDMNPSEYDQIIGLQTFESNRGTRFGELLEGTGPLSLEEINEIKFDLYFPENGIFLQEVRRMGEYTQDLGDPLLKQFSNKMLQWDGGTNLENKDAIAVTGWFRELYEVMDVGTKDYFFDGVRPTDEQILQTTKQIHKKFMKWYGTLDVKVEEAQVFERGDKRYPIPGMYDVNASLITKLDEKTGKLKADGGECYIAYIWFGDDGMKARTIVPYGASNKESSPHYNDQADMYINRQTKKVVRELEILERTGTRVYHPN